MSAYIEVYYFNKLIKSTCHIKGKYMIIRYKYFFYFSFFFYRYLTYLLCIEDSHVS